MAFDYEGLSFYGVRCPQVAAADVASLLDCGVGWA